MPYAFNLMLDPEAALNVERAYAGLAQLGIADHDLVTQYGPCVTILVLEDSVHADDLKELLARQVRRATEVAVTITEPCIIVGTPPTLSLRVTPAAGLLALHYALFSGLPEQAVHLHYRPAYWQPHVKLSNIRPDVRAQNKLVSALASDWSPMTAALRSLEVVHYAPVETFWQAPLQRHPTSTSTTS